MPIGCLCATSLNIKKHSILQTATFVGFGWFSGQRAIISLYSFNLQVFTTLTEKVYWVVRSEPITVVQVSRILLKLL
jgi:hypothetical protein